ncbi:MAG: hypothetical protein H0W76_19890 [Pyrinomonadaceae bacterium]|nr:hypothetical protein [Pyrinomonadaceae bacterium]
MPFALALALVAIISGTLATYFYDREASLAARTCAGTCTGFAALGLIGFIIASLIGLTPVALWLAAVLVAAPSLVLLWNREQRAEVLGGIDITVRDVRRALLDPDAYTVGVVLFYTVVIALWWFVFARAMFETPDGIFTGINHNFGDLPLHLGIIAGFMHGENFPPEHPEFAGVRLTYPFMVDFVAAMFVRAGASVQGALFWQNMALATALVGLLHRWVLKLTRDRAAALLTPVVLLFSGGFGWWYFYIDARESGRGIFELLVELPHDYTITPDSIYRWGNTITTLLITQRGLLFGLPLAIIIWTLWWQATEENGADIDATEGDAADRAESDKQADAGATAGGRAGRGSAKKRGRKKAGSHRVSMESPRRAVAAVSPMRRMIAAGVCAGLMPLIHAHSFGVMMGMGGCLALLFIRQWRAWAAFFALALVISVPQLFWATRESAMRPENFFEWSFGWDRGEQNAVWFWLKNTGLFIPLLITALAWRGRTPVVPKRLLLYFLPFTLCFIVPNLLRLSPWIWDNVKILFYWYVASVPLVALLLARLWRARHGGALWRVAVVGLLTLLTLAGGLDVWRVISRAPNLQVFDRSGMEFAEFVKSRTPPRARILHAPTFNHPVMLSGRRSLMGYDGHLWTHGIEYKFREADVRRIYAGRASDGEAIDALLRGHQVDYIVVGPLERDVVSVNETFFERYAKVGEAGGYRLYQTAPQ